MERTRRAGVRLAALAAALALAPAVVPAAGSARDPRQGRAELGFRTVSVDYAEYGGATGTFLDGERGLLPCLAGALELRLGPVSLRGAASLAKGALDYDGHVQSSSLSTAGLPVRSRSDARLAALEGQLGVDLPRLRGIAVVAGIGRRRWDRRIRDTEVVSRGGATVPILGLSETYAWTELHAGLLVPLVAAADVGWDAEARVTRTLAPAFSVAWGGRDVGLRLGTRTGWAIGSRLRVPLGAVLEAHLGFVLERRSFGASPRDAATGLVEPESETEQASLELGVGARF